MRLNQNPSLKQGQVVYRSEAIYINLSFDEVLKTSSFLSENNRNGNKSMDCVHLMVVLKIFQVFYQSICYGYTPRPIKTKTEKREKCPYPQSYHPKKRSTQA